MQNFFRFVKKIRFVVKILSFRVKVLVLRVFCSYYGVIFLKEKFGNKNL